MQVRNVQVKRSSRLEDLLDLWGQTSLDCQAEVLKVCHWKKKQNNLFSPQLLKISNIIFLFCLTSLHLSLSVKKSILASIFFWHAALFLPLTCVTCCQRSSWGHPDFQMNGSVLWWLSNGRFSGVKIKNKKV